MRITSVLLYKVHNIPYRYRGKYGIQKKPTLRDIKQFKEDLEREEANMLILRHPYLTSEQSQGHMCKNKEKIYKNLLNQWREDVNAKFNKKITIMDRLNHLRVTESWD
ncbi:ribosomal protein 63, mitochondrial [Frieseomelitta varia]|uniref:ribosomal protein 63, mitochondrial n=1 Tax=Frieseomelitta varia TaxID=561572 RepID=UPI001CB6888C|nr:ribosomal protein 63, mitochondrial [Frieseomelitta varia]